MKNSHEVFKETLEELGFAGHKPDQMTNSDYWLCTCTAMEKYAEQFQQNWIKIESEKDLPREGGRYLVCLKNEGVMECFYSPDHSEGWHFIDGYPLYSENPVTHWMPLPEPPKED